MAHIWLATVPNNKEHPDKTISTIQNAVVSSTSGKMYRVEIPNLVVGTLDALMSLADDLTKIGLVVEVRAYEYLRIILILTLVVLTAECGTQG
jgi:hypothetical protein